jgi:hypothetical protein
MKLAWITILIAAALANVAFGHSTAKPVREIKIHSGWGGLGRPQTLRRPSGARTAGTCETENWSMQLWSMRSS